MSRSDWHCGCKIEVETLYGRNGLSPPAFCRWVLNCGGFYNGKRPLLMEETSNKSGLQGGERKRENKNSGPIQEYDFFINQSGEEERDAVPEEEPAKQKG